MLVCKGGCAAHLARDLLAGCVSLPVLVPFSLESKRVTTQRLLWTANSP